MQVEKRSGRFSPADLLERVFEGGIVVDVSDRLSAMPAPCLLDETKPLCGKAGMLLLRMQQLRLEIGAKRQELRSAIASARKARFAAEGTAFEILIARCALEQARLETTSL